mgnify:CR=1 FL=1
MSMTRRDALGGALGLTLTTAVATDSAQAEWHWQNPIESAQEFWTAVNAYIFGYPLVTMEMTRRVITNVASVQGTRGPMGHIIKLRSYPDATFKDVTAPNADTLYTTSFLDVGKEPWLLSIPDMHDRYYSVQFTDPLKNTNFAYVGKRTTGTRAGDFLITGPGWKGQAPDGLTPITSPNRSVIVVGRVLVESDSDLPMAYDLSTQIRLTPLSQLQAA